MKQLTALLLVALLALASALAPALAEGGAILDGRWLCADLVGNVTEDTPAELKDDFGLFVNKDWILQTQIPAGESGAGAVEDIMRILKDRQIALLKDASLTGHDAELVQKLYALVSDWDYRNAQGVEPAMPVMEALRAIESLDDVKAYLYDANNLRRYFPMGITVAPDYSDPNIYITQIKARDLLLNDSAEYTAPTQSGAIYDTLYRQLGAYMLQRLGFDEDEAAAVVDNGFAFEALMAQHIKPMATHYEADYWDSLLNYYTQEELAALAGDFPILDMIPAYGYKLGERFLVEEPDYIAALAGLYTEENVPLIRDWMTLKAALSMYAVLDLETQQGAIALQNAVLGITGETSEDDIALQIVLGLLPVPMDNLYIQAYCTEQQRQDMLDIIADCVAYYRQMLESVDWLSDETREKAIEKLDNLRVRAVYPDALADWSGLDFAGIEDGGNLLAASEAIYTFRDVLQSDKIDTAVDRDAWDQIEMQTAQVNAYYNPQDNSSTSSPASSTVRSTTRT